MKEFDIEEFRAAASEHGTEVSGRRWPHPTRFEVYSESRPSQTGGLSP